MPALFLDRDGTIIHDPGYLHRPEAVQLLAGAASAIARVNARERPVIVITNQSGIARGLFTSADVDAVHVRLDELLAEHGAHIDRYYYSPHHPDFSRASDGRKPGIGLFRQAERELDLDREGSLMVGDRESDLEAGRAFGIRTALVRTGHGHLIETRLSLDGAPDCIADGLPEVVEWWLGQER